jgi:hypothetical protein
MSTAGALKSRRSLCEIAGRALEAELLLLLEGRGWAAGDLLRRLLLLLLLLGRWLWLLLTNFR